MADKHDWDRLERIAEALTEGRGPRLVADDGALINEPPPAWYDEAPLQGEPKKDAQPLPMLSLAELQAKSEAVRWLVKGVVPLDSIGLLFGASGAFKSFLALDLALHVAHGIRWLGRKTVKAPVLYIAAEGGTGIWRRIDAWHRTHGLIWSDIEFRVVPVSVDLGNDAGNVIEAAKVCGIKPQLVVADTLSQTFVGEENSATEVSAYLRQLGLWFRDTWQAATMAVHHVGHVATERPRGSSALRANVDWMFSVHREEKEMLATLGCQKQKDAATMDDQVFALHVVELGRDEDDEPITSLVARAVLSQEEKQELVKTEVKRGRSGQRHALLLELAQTGQHLEELRKVYYEAVDLPDADARRQAFYRALRWAESAGLIEIVKSGNEKRVFVKSGE